MTSNSSRSSSQSSQMSDSDYSETESFNEYEPDIPEDSESEKMCWICHASDEEYPGAAWVHPCMCRGTAKWVHHSCLQRLVVQQFLENIFRGIGGVYCPQCLTPYIVNYPVTSALALRLMEANAWYNQISLRIVFFFFMFAYYWFAVTYGAITVLQVLGLEKCSAMWGQASLLTVSVAVALLPVIPLALILAKYYVRWESALLRIIRKTINKTPFIRTFSSVRPYMATNINGDDDFPPINNRSGPIATITCGALALPTISVYFGKFLFKFVESEFYKTILGGLTFLALKGCLNMYRYQQNYVIVNKREILDFDLDYDEMDLEESQESE
ncbi:unnamed protein product [Ceutorhynchus assimilis]|uniref:E3 ubiquitin-protein ligase MARCHF5 n=1 Tax=Ceutorhynchus assimilis TaxID=467358 RepID=A0A9N9MCM3_9CUCU|nr:unnamed protein product [Ceutorhynchus assimilis]